MTPTIEKIEMLQSLMLAVENLPNNSIVRFNEVSWEDYENFLEKMESHPAHRVWYDDAKLTLQMPNPKHEKYKTFFHRIGQILAEEFEIDIEDLGSTTYRTMMNKKGVEPDVCFYAQSAKFIIGLDDFDASSAPPPDVVIEIDTTNDSWDKFSIYATLEVQEIWRYDEREIKFYKLEDEKYKEISQSIAFPLISSQMLTGFIERSKTEGQTLIMKEFRAEIKNLSSAK